MDEKFFKAKFATAGKALEQLKESYTDAPGTDEQLHHLLEAYHNLNGVEAVVYERNLIGSNNYVVFAWNRDNKSVDEKIRDFHYQMEQDGMFGQYVGERDEFLADWESGFYSPACLFSFKKTDIEIIEELQERQQSS